MGDYYSDSVPGINGSGIHFFHRDKKSTIQIRYWESTDPEDIFFTGIKNPRNHNLIFTRLTEGMAPSQLLSERVAARLSALAPRWWWVVSPQSPSSSYGPCKY
jgi:hypothetical protein